MPTKADFRPLQLELECLLESGSTEQALQTFLETNTEFILRQFVQHHCIANDLVLTKLALGQDLVSDFAFVTGSSVDFWIVLIELEKPTAKFFKDSNGKGQLEIHSDFRKGLDQINRWRSWLKVPANLLHLYEHQVGPIVRSHIHREPLVKYVLVTGRRTMYRDCVQHRNLVKAQERDDFKILSWDAVLENPKWGDPLYVGKRTDGFIDILTESLISDRLFHWIESGSIRITTTLREQAEPYSNDELALPLSKREFSIRREDLERMGTWK